MTAATKIKRVAACAITACALAIGGVALSGCANEADQIKQQLTEELDGIKNLSDEALAEMEIAIDADSQEIFSEVGISIDDLMKSYLNGFDYSIGEVKVDGDTATAEVTLTAKTQADITAAMNAAIENIDYDELVSTGDLTLIGQAIIEAIDATGPRELDPVTLTFTKVDGEWTDDESAADAVTAVLMG